MEVYQDAQKIKGKLFFKKASLLHESNLLFDAIKYYELSKSYDQTLSKLVASRIESLVDALISNSHQYKIFNLVDDLIMQNEYRLYYQIKNFVSSGTGFPYLVSMITRQLRILATIKSKLSAGETINKINQNLKR